MNTSEWKQIRSEMESRGYSVQLKGRSKKEYVCEKDNHIVDICRGGITGTGRGAEIYIYNVDDDCIDFQYTVYDLPKLLNYIDSYNI